MLDEAQARKMVAAIPGGNGTFGEVPNVGHGLHNEDMDATVGIIRKFL